MIFLKKTTKQIYRKVQVLTLGPKMTHAPITGTGRIFPKNQKQPLLTTFEFLPSGTTGENIMKKFGEKFKNIDFGPKRYPI